MVLIIMFTISVCMFVWFCTLVTIGCPFDGDVQCNDTGRCLRSTSICDGVSSCRYGNDEENCGKNIMYSYFTLYLRSACMNNLKSDTANMFLTMLCKSFEVAIVFWFAYSFLLISVNTYTSYVCITFMPISRELVIHFGEWFLCKILIDYCNVWM